MTNQLRKFKKFINSSFFGISGILLALNSVMFPQMNLLGFSKIAPSNEAGEIRAVEVNKPRPQRAVWVTVTAYSSTPDQTDDTPFITANGSRVRDGIIAANFLRFGTKVKFPEYFGNKDFEVQDRMHPRFPNRMDIWFPTREAALDFGIKKLKVEIY
ncbi:MAG: hypothetical protein AAB731_02020 [Patescibacteria group bacterium]